MKKAFLAIGLLLAVVAGVFAQTYQYQYVETINTATGVKERLSRLTGTVYGTFSGKIFYLSNDKGHKVTERTDVYPYESGSYHVANALFSSVIRSSRGYGHEPQPWTFMKEENNMLVYGYVENDGSFQRYEYLYVSKDYKRLNRRYHYLDVWSVHVFEIYEPSKPNDGPIEFY